MQNLNNINLSELLTEIIYSKFDEFDTEFNSDEWKTFYNARLSNIGLSATL